MVVATTGGAEVAVAVPVAAMSGSVAVVTVPVAAAAVPVAVVPVTVVAVGWEHLAVFVAPSALVRLVPSSAAALPAAG